MSDKNTSTLQSYIDSATGAAQTLLGNITGSHGDQAAGQAKQDKAQVENEASHVGGSFAGYSASSSGAVTKNDPNRQEGAWDQTLGSGKEFVGGLVGSQQLKHEGQQQNLQGQGKEATGQLNDYASGIGNRVGGTVEGAVAGITGDREAQLAAQDRHDVGKTQQRGAESDIQRQNQY